MKKAISLILCLFIIIASFSSCDTLRGERGFKGEDGDAGPQGEQGIQGEQGLKGDKGDKGESGEQGPKGDKGEQGENGDSYILSENDKMDIAKFLSENSMNKINITSGSGYYDTEGNWIESDEFISKYTNLISVQEGDKFTYRGLGVWNVASVIWYNVECEIISYEQYGEWDKTLAEVIVTAPKGTEYVRFCSFSGINSELILEVSYYSDNCLVSKLSGKKIVYDGDSICYGGSVGGYAQIIADNTGSEFENQAQGGARLITAGENGNYHSVVDNLKNLSTDGDIYCFQGGINDYWGDSELGTFDYINFDGELDTTTVCGALETIFI